MGFEIVDRRGGKKVVEEPKAVRAPEGYDGEYTFGTEELGEPAVLEAVADPAAKERRTYRGEIQLWKSVGFLTVMFPGNPLPAVAGRAIGLRSDELIFIADWMFPPVWPEDLSWQAETRKRLNTFRGCSCSREGKCGFHLEALPGQFGPGKWAQEDERRLKKVHATPLPECVEVAMKAEMARAQAKVVVPKG